MWFWVDSFASFGFDTCDSGGTAFGSWHLIGARALAAFCMNSKLGERSARQVGKTIARGTKEKDTSPGSRLGFIDIW